jgi:hypothetical protein
MIGPGFQTLLELVTTTAAIGLVMVPVLVAFERWMDR